ncbi:unnamed protein product [Polarella glacialis]|uniref:RING-type domain-containing protein n=1 Tax=Polarella glacialis TaxID=89957 RepID=A0A813DA37_POLGL|nr:unnamed protein product [Polarella glacialis]
MIRLGSGLVDLYFALSVWIYLECKDHCGGSMYVFLPVLWAVVVRQPITTWMILNPLAKFDAVSPGHQRVMIETLQRHETRLWQVVHLQATSCLITFSTLLAAFGTHPLIFFLYAPAMAADASLAAWAAHRAWKANRHEDSMRFALENTPERARRNYLDRVRQVCSQLRSFQFHGAPVGPDLTTNHMICDGDGYCQDPLHSSLHFQSWFLRQATCAICLDDFNSGDYVLHPLCGHLFHSACFTEWTLRGFANQSFNSASSSGPSCLFGCSKPHLSAQLLGTGSQSSRSADLEEGRALPLTQYDCVSLDSSVPTMDSFTLVSEHLALPEPELEAPQSMPTASLPVRSGRLKLLGNTSRRVVVRALAKSGDVSSTEAVLEQMRKSIRQEVSTSMYNSLLSACAKRGDARRAEHWLGAMLERKVDPDVVSYSTLIHACAKANDLQRAEHWLARMGDSNVKANSVTYNTVINACARTGNVTGAEEWVRKMEEAGLAAEVMTFNSVINACAKARDAVRAQFWLQEMRSRGIRPDNVSYTTAVHACLVAQMPHRAADQMEDMITAGERPSGPCYAGLVQAFAEASEPALACRWLQRAVDAKADVRSATFRRVALAWSLAGNAQEAERWAARA